MTISLLLFPSRLNPDRRAFKSKGATNLVFQEALIREMEFACTVGKNNECWRRHSSLRHVLDTDTIARRRGALKIYTLQEAVHLSRRDSLATLLSDALHGGEDSIHVLAAGS